MFHLSSKIFFWIVIKFRFIKRTKSNGEKKKED